MRGWWDEINITSLRPVAAIKFKIVFFFSLNNVIKIYVLCPIVNKIWVYEICKSLHSVIIYIFNSVQFFFGTGGCILTITIILVFELQISTEPVLQPVLMEQFGKVPSKAFEFACMSSYN